MPQQPSKLYVAAKETLEEYFQKTSLNGFGLLHYIRRRKYQRLFWFLFIVMGCSFATYVVLFTLLSFWENPTVTSMASQHYPITRIPFPAIAVCSVNKISRFAVENYALKLSKQLGKDLNYWYQKMELFINYFDDEINNYDNLVDFQTELNSLLNGNENFNVSDTLKLLAPKCNDLLLACNWAGHSIACNKIVRMLATSSGYCCIFNYQSDSFEMGTIYYPNGTGVNMGLSLLLNTSTNDYYYAERSVNGFIIQIFDPYNFPDPSMGGVREVFISEREIVDIELSVITQMASNEARNHAVDKRRCYFDNENVVEYGSSYSQAECLSRCKIQKIFKRCDCIPYYAHIELFQEPEMNVTECNLMHMECLSRHEEETAVFDWQQRSLNCPDCLPLCSYNYYNFLKSNSEFKATKHLAENKKIILEYSDVPEEVSLVNLYFASDVATQYRKNVVYNWYQILSNIGGVIGICIGCSLISGFEIIYFLCFRFFENLIKFYKVNRN